MIKPFLFFSVFSLLAGPFASATITVTGIYGVSDYVLDTTTGISIIAGVNGADACSASSTGTCNTCVDHTVPDACNSTTNPDGLGCCGGYQCFSCNQKAVTDSTVLTINFTSDKATTGVPVLKAEDGGTYTSTSGTGSGGTFVYTTTWANVCRAMTDSACTCFTIADGSCTAFTNTSLIQNDLTIEVTDGTNTDTASIPFKLYFQKNTTAATGWSGGTPDVPTVSPGALAGFTAYPGDEKVYIENPSSGSGDSFPNSSAGLIKYIYFYIGTGSFQNAYSITTSGNTITPSLQAVDTEGGVDQVISGLDNDVYFHFRPASVDEAGNVFAVMDDKYLTNVGGCNLTTDGGGGCPYAAKPSKVLGLLTEDMNCFVTTAAYGSNLDPHIDTFRTYRNHVLIQSPLGKKLIFAYYKYGPKMAQTIVDHQWLRPLARVVLWPAWGLTTISLYFHLNLWQSFALLLGSVLLSFTLFVFGFYGLLFLRRRNFKT